MDNKKLTNVIPMVKKGIRDVLKFDNLGYIMKTYILVSLIVGAIALSATLIRVVPLLTSGVNYVREVGAQETQVDTEVPAYLEDFYEEYEDNYDYNYGGPTDYSGTTPDYNRPAWLVVVGGLLSIVTAFAGVYAMIVLLITGINVSEGNLEESRNTLEKAWNFLLRFAGLKIIKGFIIGIGFILFIIPGIILSIMFTFAEISMIRENLGIFKSLGRSANLTKEFRWQLFLRRIGLGLSIMGIAIVLVLLGWQIIPISIPLFGAGMAMILTNYMDELKTFKTAQAPVEKNPELPKTEA